MKHLAARRYAKALFEAALETGVLEESANDLKQFADAFDRMPLLSNNLENSELSMKKRIQILDAVCDVVGCKKIIRDFLKILLMRDRINSCSYISKIYGDYVVRALNLVSAKVYIADEKIKIPVCRDISAVIESVLKKKVQCEVLVNPELIGGVMLKIGDCMLDASVKGRMDQLKQRLFMR